MIVLTVKTLDSQNHSFTVEDDITVEQFKSHIAETVNIPADTQRIIYCGRVLQDSSKLSDYDVNGKVVHLVQRAPPSATNSRAGRSNTPPPLQPRRMMRRLDGNAMYLGSMAFPSNLMESQGFASPPPTHSLAGSRLNVARRMLRRAETVIRLLENPSARPNEQAPPEDTQEEVTPVIEARVIVPASEPIDQAVVFSAVQNSLMTLDNQANNSAAVGGNTPVQVQTDSPTDEQQSENSTSTSRGSAENLASEERSENNAAGAATSDSTTNNLAENASRTSEMAELLALLGQLQSRFAPFLERYQTFMAEDPVVAPENLLSTHAMLRRVSEVLHFLGHAYHSLSDIIIRVRSPPPRPLLCCPILIQHSAIVRAGIPIQVEAQINLSDRPPQASNVSQAAADSTSTTSSSNTSSTQSSSTINIGALPFLFPSMRGQTIPFEIRSNNTRSTPTTATPQRSQNNNNTDGSTAPQPRTTGTTSTSTSTTQTTSANSSNSSSFNFNNPDFEFFMEVTPEVLRGALNGPPPDFVQSLMQMAGQFINRASGSGTTTTGTSTSDGSQQPNTTSTTNAQQQSASAGQNSQARGNTQTNPTTATHTRSTARPHVQLAHQAMQGGFDPFLPCNSHHVNARRRAAAHRNSSNNSSSGNRTGENQNRTAPTPSSDPTDGNAHDLGFLNRLLNSTSTQQGSARMPFNIPEEMISLTESLIQGHVEGESLFNDLLVTLIISSIFQNRDLTEALSSNHVEIENYFLENILQGPVTPENVNRGVERVINEMRPLIEQFREMPIRDNIDIVRSFENLLRLRLPRIISSASQLRTQNVPNLIKEVCCTFRHLIALALRASRNGQNDLHHIVEIILTRFLEGISRPLLALTISACNLQIQRIVSNLSSSVRDSTITEILVQQSPSTVTPTCNNISDQVPTQIEQMDLDSDFDLTSNEALPPVATVAPAGDRPILLNDSEPLPNIVLGSESWHGQVPDDWVPIITRDAQKQRRQNSQGPYSDAYLSGMPSKRRKIVNSNKPEGTLSQVISESVRQAVTATGLTAAAPIEAVVQAAGESVEIQSAYRNILRTTVQASLRDNEDFTADRYPNTSTYFNQSQPQ